MSEKASEVVYLNSCDLCIESFDLKRKVAIYFVWKKGKKFSQSLKYQLTQEPIFTKDTLSLNLKIYQQGNNILPKYATLIIYDSAGEEIDRVKLIVTEWGSEYKQLTLNIAGGVAKVKVRRKAIMRLQNFHRLRGEVEQSSEDQLQFQRKASKKQYGPRQQLMRLSKQVQDLGYMVQKLKVQRNGALVKAQELQIQLSQVNDKMAKDIRKMRDYYQLKIQMRQSIFKDQIQQLVTSFNKNYELNKFILEGLIKEKYEYQQEIGLLKESNQQYIQRQQQNYQNVINVMEGHKKILDEDLKDTIDKLSQRQADIVELKDQISSLTQELDERVRELEQERELRDAGQKQSKRIISELNIRNNQLQNEVQDLSSQVKDWEATNRHLQEDINTLQKLIEDHVKEKEELRDQQMKQRGEYTRLQIQLQGTQDLVEQLQRQVEEKKMDLDRVEQDYNIKLEGLIKDHQHQQSLHKQQEEISAIEKNDLIKLNLALTQENMTLTDKYQDTQYQLLAKENQNGMLKNEVQQSAAMIGQMQKDLVENNNAFRLENQQLSEKLGHFMAENNRLEVENANISSDLRQLGIRSREQVERLKQEYQGIIESNKKLQEDEVQFYKRQREDDLKQFDQFKEEYEKQVQLITNHQKEELEQMEKSFRQELQLKNKQYLELMQRIQQITELYQNQKLQGEMIRFKNENDQEVKQIIKKLNRVNDKRQPEEIPQQGSQQEESEEEQQKPKGHKKRKKKKQLSEQQEEGDSLANIFQKKKSQATRKLQGQKDSKSGRLKKRNLIEEQEEDFNVLTIQSFDREQHQGSEEEKESLKFKKKKNDSSISSGRSEEKIKGRSQRIKKLKKKDDSIPIDSSLEVRNQELQQRVDNLQQENRELKKGEKKLKDQLAKQQSRYEKKILLLQAELSDLNIQINQLMNQLKGKDANLANNITKSAQKRKIDREKMGDLEAQKQKEKQKHLQKERLKQLQKEKQEDREREKQKERQRQKSIQRRGRHLQKSRQRSEKGSESSNKRSCSSPRDKKSSGEQYKEKDRSKSPPKFDEKYYKNRLLDLEQIIDQRREKIQKLQAANKQLKKNFQKYRGQFEPKLNIYESKIIELQKRDTFKLSLDDIDMKQSINDIEGRLAIEKERSHDFKLKLQQKVKQNQQITAEAQKLKRQLQEKSKEVIVPRSVREIQGQLDQSNRKILELSRGLNFAKLQRDTFQEEVRILKKRLGQVSKLSQQWQSKSMETERQADDLRRKEGKSRRQMDELSEQAKKNREQIRRLQEQISQLNKSQGDYVHERKKVLQQLTRLEQVIAKKDVQIMKSQREVQKLKGRIQEGEDSKQGRQTELKTEIQKVDQLRLKAERRVRELQEGMEGLHSQLESSQRENKRTIQSQKQNYGQKLKHYIEQIINFKKILEDYQAENSRLKIQNSEFFQQNEILKVSFEKLEIKYEGLMEHEEKFMEDIAKNKETIIGLKEQVNKKTIEEQKFNLAISGLRKQLDNQRVVSRKKTQKLQSYEQINQRYLYEIKNLKIRLSEYESTGDLSAKLAQKCALSERTIQSLQDELRRVSGQLQERSTKYVYSREEVQQALRELKANQQKVKEEEFTRLVQQLDKNHQQRREKMETQLISLFNQNQRLRIGLQRIGDENTEYQLALSQLEPLRERNKRLERDNLTMERRVNEGLQEIKALREEVRRGEIRLNQSIRSQEGKSTENAILLRKYQQLEFRYKDLIQNHSQLKQDNKKLLQRYKGEVAEREEAIQKLDGNIQVMANKLLAAELQVNRLREAEKINSQQYLRRVKVLQVKMQEMSETFKEHEIATEAHYEKKIVQLTQGFTRAEEELEDKLARIQELNEGLLMMQGEVDALTQQLTAARSQLAEDGETYTIQLNKLRGQIKNTEEAYDANICQLEEELSEMSKQLTALRCNRQAGGSRVGGSRASEVDDKTSKRYQQKLKMKEKRIEQLKQNILSLQQTVNQAMRREITEKGNEQVEKWTRKYQQTEKNWKDKLQNHKTQITKLREQIMRMKTDNAKLKNQNQQIRLELQEKVLFQESLKSELKTINQLYCQLQRQLDRRKNTLNLQMGEQSSYKVELNNKQLELQSTQAHLEELRNKFAAIEAQLKKKTNQNKNLLDRLSGLQLKQSVVAESNKKVGHQQAELKVKLRQLGSQLQDMRTQLRKSRNEVGITSRQNDFLKSEMSQLKNQVSGLASQLGDAEARVNESQRMAGVYIQINQQSFTKFGVGVQQIMNLALNLKQKVAEREADMSKYFQQIEELKFLYDRKYSDWEALRKENYDLSLKLQQAEIRDQQLQQYHVICEQLQRQKKEAVFREESMRLQLGNFLMSMHEERRVEWKDVRKRMQNILTNNFDLY